VDDLLDAHAGGVLEMAGDGQRGEDDGHVGFDRVAGVVEDRPGSEVALAHPERGFDVPQLVVAGDDLGCGHQVGGDVRNVPLLISTSAYEGLCRGRGYADGRLIVRVLPARCGVLTRVLGIIAGLPLGEEAGLPDSRKELPT